MKIYIPKHLRELGIFRDLARMISVYESGYKDPTSSFDNYQSYMKIDPVLRFVSFCIHQGEDQSEEEYRAILEYVTRLFYSLRGTRKLFDYMPRYLGIKFVGDPVYTTKSINFSIGNDTEWYDVSLFNTYLIDFLNCLLYYESLNYKVDLGLKIMEDKKFYLGSGVMTYKIYEIEEE